MNDKNNNLSNPLGLDISSKLDELTHPRWIDEIARYNPVEEALRARFDITDTASKQMAKIAKDITISPLDVAKQLYPSPSEMAASLGTALTSALSSRELLWANPSQLANVYDQLSKMTKMHSPVVNYAAAANLSVLSILEKVQPATIDIEKIVGVSKSWHIALEGIWQQGAIDATIATFASEHLSRITEVSLLAQNSLANLRWESIGRKLEIKESIRAMVSTRFLEFSASYSELFKAYEQPGMSMFTLSPSLVELPTVEFFGGVDLLGTTVYEEDSEGVEEYEEERNLVRSEIRLVVADTLEHYLISINPDLINLREGAKQAAKSNNPDRVRHCITSLRELVRIVMHSLSPDDEFKSWSKSPNDYDDNRPTRAGRLRFINRRINHGPFTKFVEKDIEATIAAIELFNAGTHTLNSKVTEVQLDALIAKVETTLLFLIEIAKQENE